MIRGGGIGNNLESIREEILLRMEEQGLFLGFPSEHHGLELLFS